ncbi:MAG: glycosyltransferase [Alphaproteobacteria bacterium]|nr:glycosyltransferase [Alphaproteobacteria bacterium]
MQKQLLRKRNFSKPPLISVCIPVLNEVDNIGPLYSRLQALADKMADRCSLEFIFTDNRSSDGTWERLAELARHDQRVRALRFSKGVGFQRSILANYIHARGEAALQIDADLQDPPEMLEQFFAKWQEGYDVIYGVRRGRQEGWSLNQFRKFGYWVIDAISEHPIPRDVGDFRLVDRKVIEACKKYRYPQPYLRGLIAGLGFWQTGIVYDRAARTAGLSKFPIKKMIHLGLTGVFNHSTVPLRLATYMGLFFVGVSIVGVGYYLFLKIVHPDLPQGLASLHILVLFGIGFLSFLLGLLGEYLLRIYLILRQEPLAIVDETLNFLPEEVKL